MSLPTVLVVFDGGAVSPLEILAHTEGVAQVTFCVPRGSPEYLPYEELLRELGPVPEVDVDDPGATLRSVGEVAGVVSFAEGGVVPAAVLADALGLPGVGTGAARRVRDKAAQRRCLREAGLRSPESVLPRAGRAAKDLEAVGGVAVLKPRSGFGSRFTYRVDSAEVLEERLAHLAERGLPEDGQLLETLIPGDPSAAGPQWGDYVSVESAVRDGVARHLGVSGRFHPVPPFRETGMVHPDTLDEPTRNAVLAEATRALTALRLSSCLAHTEIKLSPDGPVVIEVNARLGGLVDTLLCRTNPGALVRAGVGLATGDTSLVDDQLALVGEDRVNYNISLYPEVDGRVTVVTGVDELARRPGVDSVRVLRRPGDHVDVDMGTFGESVVVLGSDPDHRTVLETLEYARRTVTVVTS